MKQSMSPSANGFRKCAQPRNAPSSSWRFPQFGIGDMVLCVDCGGPHRSDCVEGGGGEEGNSTFSAGNMHKNTCLPCRLRRKTSYIRTALRPFEEVRHVFFLRPSSREAIYHPLLLLWEHGRWPGSRTPNEPSRQVILF